MGHGPLLHMGEHSQDGYQMSGVFWWFFARQTYVHQISNRQISELKGQLLGAQNTAMPKILVDYKVGSYTL